MRSLSNRLLVLVPLLILIGIWEARRNTAQSPTVSCCIPQMGIPNVDSVPQVMVPREVRRAPVSAAVGRTASWAIPFGSEFWHRELKAKSRGGALAPSMVQDAIDRVTHAYVWDGDTGCVVVAGGTVQVSGEGLSFTRGSNDEGAQKAVAVRTRSIRVGGEEIIAGTPKDAGAWVVNGNTAQRLRDENTGLVEHYEARTAGVELSWILSKRPEGDACEAEIELSGVHFRSQDSAGLRFATPDMAIRVVVGEVRAVDASGQHWDVPTERDGELLRIQVPAAVLAQAEYPLAVDPLISPEFELDNPVLGPSPSTQGAPVIAASESGYLVAWIRGAGGTTSASVYAARMDPIGQLLDPFGILVGAAGEQSTCAVASNPGGYLVVWSGPRGTSTTDWDIYGARIQADGEVLDANPLSICGASSSVQCTPAVAANGTNYLVTWRDSRGTGIYGTLVDLAGRVSVTNGFSISSAVNEQFTPAVASLGGDYLVVWQDYRKATSIRLYSDIYGARVTGGGRLMDTNGIPICTLTNSQYHPAVAADGTNYLVVWEHYSAEGYDVEGSRVSREGVVVDSPPIAISHGRNLQSSPSVSGTSNGWVVVWEDFRDSTTNHFQAHIRGAAVLDGAVMPADGGRVASVCGMEARPSVASCGGGVLVVWQDGRNNPGTTLADIFGAEAGDGLVYGADFNVSKSANAELTPVVAASGTNYLVAWSDNRNAQTRGRDILGVRLNQDGQLLDANAIPICTQSSQQSDPAVASNGTNYLVAWADWRNTPANATHADIYGALVDLAGQVNVLDGFAICTVTNDQTVPTVARLGTNYLVAWQDARSNVNTVVRLDVYGARVSERGEVLDPAGFAICTNSGNQTLPAAAGNDSQALVAWTDFRHNTVLSDIYAARVTEDGVLDPTGIPLCRATGAQSAPAIATDGSGFLVAWADPRNGVSSGMDIYGILVAADGIATPTNGFPIRVVPGIQSAPTVAFNGSDYFVGWQESRTSASNSFDVYGIGIDADGSVWRGGPLAITTEEGDQQAPMAAAGGDGRFLIANQGFRHSAPRTVANLGDISALPRINVPRVSGGVVELELHGTLNARYRIEGSVDLKTWLPVDTLTLTNGAAIVLDPAATTNVFRFYRAALLP
jgi:hypothetical protein